MGVYKYIGIHLVKNTGKTSGIPGVGFYKIPVEVKVAGITPETVFRRSILIDPCCRIPVEGTTNIIYRNCYYDGVLGNRDLFAGIIPEQHHRGIYAIAFAWMNTIINKDNSLVFLYFIKIKNFLGTIGYQMQWLPAVSKPVFFYSYCGVGFCQLGVITYNLVISGSFCTIGAFKNRFKIILFYKSIFR